MMISSFGNPLNNIRNQAAAKSASAPQAQPQEAVVSDQVEISRGGEATPAQAAAPVEQPDIRRTEIPGSFIVVADSNKLVGLAENTGVQVERVLGTAGESTFLLVQAGKSDQAQLESFSAFQSVMPNYEYEGKLYDDPIASDAPQDAPAAGRPRHLDIINIDQAWAVTKGSPNVITAITDGGVDLAHPELKDSVYKNPGEIAGNGIDDDNNGFIDDISGWDFTDNDNVAGHEGSDHHTHVHGIAHAREGTSGATGVAPGAKSMPLRIDGGRRRYSSAMVAEAYLYAMNNGAKSVNTSYNIDGFVGDQAIETAYRTLADNDVLVFNSAGNSGRLNPARSAFEDVVLVASTDSTGSVDKRSSFSNYGIGIDIAAPGKDIVSTLPSGRTGALSGTSMASPGAMGLHALVQSANPDWNRAQRWAQIAGTADNIDDKNAGEAGLFGGGRINAGRALTETLAAPTLSVKETKNPNGGVTKLTVRFDKVIDPNTANAKESWQVLNSDGEVVMQGSPKEVRLLTNTLDFNVGSLPAGSYEFVASADSLKDPFGQALDGDRDGKAGGNFVHKFDVK